MMSSRFKRVSAAAEELSDRANSSEPATLRSMLPSLVTAAAVYLVIQLWLVAKRVPIGHDEAVYLLRGRFLAGGTATGGGEGYWSPYRAPGLPALLSVSNRVVGESISLSRLVVVLFGVATIVATGYWVGRLAGRVAGSIAPWMVIMTAAFTSYGSLVLLDIPGTFLVLIAAIIVERSTVGGVVSWWPLSLLPVVAMAAVYTRFGAPTNLAAVIAAVVLCRADLLLAAGRRATAFIRLGVIGALTAVAVGAVLVVPALTQSRTSPLRLQRIRQERKEVSAFASYRDTLDLLWPNGSRTGEAFTWVGLVVIAIGIVLAIVAAVRGMYRRAVIAGAIGTVVWIVGLNYALAEMFGNYLGLGVPFIALLASPGWAFAYHHASLFSGGQRAAVAAASIIAILGSAQALTRATEQVEAQVKLEPLRSAGAAVNEVAPDQECALFTSYVQITWYADCVMTNFGVMQYGTYGAVDPQRRGVFDLDEIERDHLYVVLVDGGKRQPEGDRLETILGDSQTAITVPDARLGLEVRQITDVD